MKMNMIKTILKNQKIKIIKITYNKYSKPIYKV